MAGGRVAGAVGGGVAVGEGGMVAATGTSTSAASSNGATAVAGTQPGVGVVPDASLMVTLNQALSSVRPMTGISVSACTANRTGNVSPGPARTSVTARARPTGAPGTFSVTAVFRGRGVGVVAAVASSVVVATAAVTAVVAVGVALGVNSGATTTTAVGCGSLPSPRSNRKVAIPPPPITSKASSPNSHMGGPRRSAGATGWAAGNGGSTRAVGAEP